MLLFMTKTAADICRRRRPVSRQEIVNRVQFARRMLLGRRSRPWRPWRCLPGSSMRRRCDERKSVVFSISNESDLFLPLLLLSLQQLLMPGWRPREVGRGEVADAVAHVHFGPKIGRIFNDLLFSFHFVFVAFVGRVSRRRSVVLFWWRENTNR